MSFEGSIEGLPRFTADELDPALTDIIGEVAQRAGTQEMELLLAFGYHREGGSQAYGPAHNEAVVTTLGSDMTVTEYALVTGVGGGMVDCSLLKTGRGGDLGIAEHKRLLVPADDLRCVQETLEYRTGLPVDGELNERITDVIPADAATMLSLLRESFDGAATLAPGREPRLLPEGDVTSSRVCAVREKCLPPLLTGLVRIITDGIRDGDPDAFLETTVNVRYASTLGLRGADDRQQVIKLSAAGPYDERCSSFSLQVSAVQETAFMTVVKSTPAEDGTLLEQWVSQRGSQFVTTDVTTRSGEVVSVNEATSSVGYHSILDMARSVMSRAQRSE